MGVMRAVKEDVMKRKVKAVVGRVVDIIGRSGNGDFRRRCFKSKGWGGLIRITVAVIRRWRR